jgi:hypothetical protein
VTNEETTITLPDGRVFPVFEGEALSWDLGFYFTPAEEKAGLPKLRAVYAAAKEHRPELIEREEAVLLRAQFNRMFGFNAERLLNILRALKEE